MREAVLDGSVLLKWFNRHEERYTAQARSLRSAYEAGTLRVLAPRFVVLEVLNVAGRRWRQGEEELAALAQTLEGLRFELVDPALAAVAHWTARGLSAYDAAYVVTAETTGAPLVTDDGQILRLAPGIARSLADAA